MTDIIKPLNIIFLRWLESPLTHPPFSTNYGQFEALLGHIFNPTSFTVLAVFLHSRYI